MNLTQLKAEAEKAKTSDIELGFWREDISPDDVLRLVEVARAAAELRQIEATHMQASPARYWAKVRLDRALEGMEE